MKKKVKFDFISDVHVNSWNCTKTMTKMDRFVDKLIPHEPNDVLLVAGDISHYNSETITFLKSLKKVYKDILFVLGNHDYWLLSSTTKKYKDSYNRVENLISDLNGLTNVHFLDGNIVDIAGVKYGGCTGWYDFSYGKNVLNMSEDEVKIKHRDTADYKHIYVGEHLEYDYMHNRDKEKLEHISKYSDVIMTHHIPNWERVQFEYKLDWYTGVFYFDGYDLIKNNCKDKVWLFGHTHVPNFYTYEDCEFISNPFGYRGEYFDLNVNYVKFPRMIRSYESE